MIFSVSFLAYLKSLHSNGDEEALSQLLSHLPLLNPGNGEARGEYMKLLPKVMLGSSEEMDYFDRCRQLLSLALVHPAFPHEDRDALTYWRSQLDARHKTIADRQGGTSPPSSSSSPQRPPPIPPRIRQIKTNEDIRQSPVNSRIYIEGDLMHDTPNYSTDPYNADDEEVQRALSKTLQSRQPPPFSFGGSGHTSPLPSSYEEGGMVGKANTIPRMTQKEDQGTSGLNSFGGSMEWQAGMKGKWVCVVLLHLSLRAVCP